MKRALVLLLLTACGGSVATTDATTATVETTPAVTTIATAPSTTAEVTTTTTATTTSAAADAAPPELAGRWQKESQGERVFLSLTGTNYAFVIVGQGQASAGRIAVEGNQIRFYDANTAPGEGIYEWKVDRDTLTFVELEPPDEHGGRRAGLVDVIWTRLG